MTNAVEILSPILWAVTLFAAGLYPFGIMLGGACSECCDDGCEEMFYRCLRVKSVNGSAPDIPPRLIYWLKEAGIVKASSNASAVITGSVQPHQHLSAGEFTEYKLDAAAFDGTNECPGTAAEYTIRVEGRDYPLQFYPIQLENQYDGSPLSASATATSDVEYFVNLNATISASIVAAKVEAAYGSSSPRIDGGELTDTVLRSLLTVSPPAFSPSSFGGGSRVAQIGLTLSGDRNVFRYLTAPVVLTWLVRFTRGSAQTHFTVTATVWHGDPVALPEGGLEPLNLTPWPTTIINTPTPPPLPAVISGNSITTAASKTEITTFALPVTIPLTGKCTLDVQTIRFKAPKSVTGHASPYPLASMIFTTLQPASKPLDTYVFRIGEYIGSGENYDTTQVAEFRAGTRAMRITQTRSVLGGTVSSEFDLVLAEPSPLCGASMCELPQELLPSGVTFTPVEGSKYECKNAYPVVLGNPEGGCYYSHATNECKGYFDRSVRLYDFFTQYPLNPNGTVVGLYVPDALTWLEFEPQPLVKPEGTYTVGGEYNPAAGRYGACYGYYSGRIAGFGTPVYSRSFIGHSWHGGVCPPAEYTVTLSDAKGTADGVDYAIPEVDGEYVLKADSVNCNKASYYYEGMEYSESEKRFLGVSVGLVAAVDDAAFSDVNFGGAAPYTPCAGQQWISVSASFLFKRDDGTAVGGGARGADPQVVGPSVFQGNASLKPMQGYGGIFFGPDYTFYQSGACAIDADYEAGGSKLAQCGGVTFSPTSVELGPSDYAVIRHTETTPLPGEVTITASGPAGLCGGAWLLSGNASSSYRTARGDQGPGLWPGTLDISKETNEQKRWVVSDGSAPQQITVKRKPQCGRFLRISRSDLSPGVFAYVDFTIEASAEGDCFSLVVIPAGQECEWTAVSDSTWLTVNEEATEGKGTQPVRITADAKPSSVAFARFGNVTFSLTVDPTVKITVSVRQ